MSQRLPRTRTIHFHPSRARTEPRRPISDTGTHPILQILEKLPDWTDAFFGRTILRWRLPPRPIQQDLQAPNLRSDLQWRQKSITKISEKSLVKTILKNIKFNKNFIETNNSGKLRLLIKKLSQKSN